MPIHHSGGEDKYLPQRLTVPTHFHSRPNSLSPLIFPAGRRARTGRRFSARKVPYIIAWIPTPAQEEIVRSGTNL